MKAQEAVRKIIANSGKSQAGVSKAMGKTRNYVNAIVTQADSTGGTLGCETLAGIASACGYSLAVMPAGDVPSSALVIDPPE